MVDANVALPFVFLSVSHNTKATAATIEAILLETAQTQVTERGATRLDDQTSEAAMELRKKEGYF